MNMKILDFQVWLDPAVGKLFWESLYQGLLFLHSSEARLPPHWGLQSTG